MSALFPAADIRLAAEDALTRALAEAAARRPSLPVAPRIDVAALRSELTGWDFDAPRKLEDVLDWSIARLEHGVVQIAHPRYFGLFNPAPSFPAQCADRVAAAFNPQLATATTSPAAIEIEAHVIRAWAARLGLAGAAGHFTTGGSEANATALLCALTRAHPGFAQDGVRAFAGAPVFYASRECHLAWVKIAVQTGLGRAAARLVPTDGSGRMDPAALIAAIAADRAAGCIPVMVVATAGTTNAGMVDPLAACADIAAQAGMWFHVDAAWGGAAAASDRLRPLLAGIERADSVTLDAHKWLATTMACGMIFVADGAVLSEAFAVATTFMPSYSLALDPYVTTLQWSRRFLGLRLFVAMAAAGWDGYAAHVEQSVDLVASLRARLLEAGWRVLNESGLAVVCAQPPEGAAAVRPLVARVVASGAAWVSAATFEGQDVVRACVTSGESTEADIAALMDALIAARAAA